MIDIQELKSGKYVVAVSGGVDSVALLDLLSHESELELIVAHFDHGIRQDSAKDAKLVRRLAKQYDLPFELKEGRLGTEASEAKARKARYDFLRQVRDEHQAEAIITAHHQDDVIETAIINLLRGTYRKGLSSLKSTNEIIRPLLGVPKHEIIEYADKNGLTWREDITNTDTRYLRNYVRQELIPSMKKLDEGWRQRILGHIDTAGKLNQDINDTLDFITLEKVDATEEGLRLDRHWLIMLPNSIGREVLLYMLDRAEAPRLSSQRLNRMLIFCKTARNGKRMEIANGVDIVIDGKQILVTNQ